MNQGLGIVLPLVFFFLIDVTLFVNLIRQKTDTAIARLFTKLAGVTTASYLWVETKYHEKQKRSISYKDNG